MPNEYITYEQVNSGVQELRNCANQMEEIFNNVTNNMRNITTKETWQGIASDELSSDFETFRGGFTEYVAKVREFADAFEAAATALQSHETNLKGEVSNI